MRFPIRMRWHTDDEHNARKHGYLAGYRHAAEVFASGPRPHASVPPRYAAHELHWQDGYDQGLDAFEKPAHEYWG